MPVTLEQLNKRVDALSKDVAELKEILEDFDLSDTSKRAITKSRRRAPEKFKTQEEIEKKFS